MTITLVWMPILAITLLLLWAVLHYRMTVRHLERTAVRKSAARATDRQHWDSLDY
jgi:hypothetical protein